MTVSTTTTTSPRRWRTRRSALAAALAGPVAALGLLTAPATGQSMKPAGDGSPIQGTSDKTPQAFKGVGIKQNRDAQIPADAAFKDDQGRDVTLADYFAGGRFNKEGRPVLFTLVYFGCPSLCTMVLNEMNKSLTAMPADFNPGKQYEVVVISFDPSEGPALAYEKKKAYVAQLRRDGADAGFHYLTGPKDSIDKVCDAVGFTYAWDETHKQFIHAGGIMVLTPAGRVSRYFYGVEYVPRDVRLALADASGGKIGGLAEQVMLFCFQYNPHTGTYTLYITRLVQVFGGVLVLGIGAFMLHSYRRDRRVRLTPQGADAGSGLAEGGFPVEPRRDGTIASDGSESATTAADAAASKDVKDNG